MLSSPRKSLDAARSRAAAAVEETHVPADIPVRRYVVDRRGNAVDVRFDRITDRLSALCAEPRCGRALEAVDVIGVVTAVIDRFRNGMTTRELDLAAAEVCAERSTRHREYDLLAARILVSDLHKRTPESMRDMIAVLRRSPACRVADGLAAAVARGGAAIDARLDFARDYRFGLFGYQTLARIFLQTGGERNEVTERPQHLYMRVALGVFAQAAADAPEPVWARALEEAFEFYDALSLHLVSNASPTMLNVGTPYPQASSCYQMSVGDDMVSLMMTVGELGIISCKSAGISLALHEMRSIGSLIRSTGGTAKGVCAYAPIINDVQIYSDQGGRRPGAVAIYLAVDHADVLSFIEMARPTNPGVYKAAELKYALWVPDRFMRVLAAEIAAEAAGAAETAAAVEAAGVSVEAREEAAKTAKAKAASVAKAAGAWHIFDPRVAPGLQLVHGAAYDALYEQYVAEGRYCKCIRASDIIHAAHKSWAACGVPYVLFKDHINAKTNMMNVAPITSSNLCAEITLPCWSNFDAEKYGAFHPDNAAGGEIGVCNLASICLESFVDAAHCLDYGGIIAAAALEARVLNRVIDLNAYPDEKARRSNRRHRPIGIGIMGFADVLADLRIAYGSTKALTIAQAAAACVYYGAASQSAADAVAEGPYASYAGSPVSAGRLTPDLWAERGELAADWEDAIAATTRGALTPAMWAELRRAAATTGMRNAYLTAMMPTATTSNVVGQNECFEPFTSNLYTRQTLAGEFVLVNRHLVRELSLLGLWNEELRRDIVARQGSVKGHPRIPADVARRYLTAREIHPTKVVRTAAALAPFVCQSLSMNLWLAAPDLPRILRFLFEAHAAGLKTGMYYCHTLPAAAPRAPASAAASASNTPASAAAAAASTPTAAPAAPAHGGSVDLILAMSPSSPDELSAAPACTPGCASCSL